MKTKPHDQRRPDIVAVLKGQKYSCACGAEARCQKIAPHDGIAVDGVLFTVEEYLAPIKALDKMRKGNLL